MNDPKFVGVRRGKSQRKPWLAQLRALGRCYHLGSFETPEEAARAFDNAAFYFKRTGYRCRFLNFPKEWNDSYLPPTEATERALAQCCVVEDVSAVTTSQATRAESLESLHATFRKLLALVRSADETLIAAGYPSLFPAQPAPETIPK